MTAPAASKPVKSETVLMSVVLPGQPGRPGLKHAPPRTWIGPLRHRIGRRSPQRLCATAVAQFSTCDAATAPTALHREQRAKFAWTKRHRRPPCNARNPTPAVLVRQDVQHSDIVINDAIHAMHGYMLENYSRAAEGAPMSSPLGFAALQHARRNIIGTTSRWPPERRRTRDTCRF